MSGEAHHLKQTLASRLSQWVSHDLDPVNDILDSLLEIVGGLSDERAEFQLESKAMHHVLSKFREETNIFCLEEEIHVYVKRFEHTISMWKQCGLHRKEPAHDSTESEGVTHRSAENHNPLRTSSSAY